MGACESSSRSAEGNAIFVDVLACDESLFARRTNVMCCSEAEQEGVYKVMLDHSESPAPQVAAAKILQMPELKQPKQLAGELEAVELSTVETPQARSLSVVAEIAEMPERREAAEQSPVGTHQQAKVLAARRAKLREVDAEPVKLRDFKSMEHTQLWASSYPCPPSWLDHKSYVKRLQAALVTFALEPELLEMQVSARRSRLPAC
eukprot:TRINITY_DN88596_c0_g1_i1.p1 TRINITY_DN88596_c0_g1~~TRINITY_DN88596_c0_g1_i1.p1  ORF type:complete len:222 (+),score=46.95 TRINITY_DN88596_c0_g1_i1:52-666(+)